MTIHPLITPALVLLLIIIGLLVTAVVQWSRYVSDVKILQRTANDTRVAIDHLTEALTEDFDGNDVLLSLRESKHFTEGFRHEMRAAIDELYQRAGLPPLQWTDREEARRVFLQRYHDRLTQQGPS